MLSFRRLTLASILVAICALAAPAAVPTPSEYLGYKIGSRFTTYDHILGYFKALEVASPLVKVHEFGHTWEGRPLVYAVITSEKNQAAIDEIRGKIEKISRPDETSQVEAKEIAKSTPAIVWLAFGVHGNEASSSEAAMLTARWLLSGTDETRRILERVVVIIDPLENPDGRERYIEGYRQRVGTTPNANPSSWEHIESWPGGRYNHYLVDMNRDWAWGTQPETRARIKAFQKWNPQVFVDLHEMGYNASYFFPPPANPINSNVDPDTKHFLDIFGKANAAAFTSRGWPFFVGEVYDLFYPGYGDSWPTLHGAIGMTYEMAGGGGAGTVVKRDDDTLLTLAGRVEKHFTTAKTTVETTAAHREELVLHTWSARRRSIAAPEQNYLILDDSPNFRHAIHLLRLQKIELEVLRKGVRLRATSIDDGSTETREFPAGTAVVSTRQPLGALARTLLERTPHFPEEFIRKQREKVQADESQDFYDITGWSIPISHDLTAFVTSAPIAASSLGDLVESRPAPFRDAKLGWLIDGLDPEVYRAAGRLLKDGVKFGVSLVDLEVKNKKFARGTLVIRRDNNADDVAKTLASIERDVGAEIDAVDDGWTQGPSLGSPEIAFVRDPGIVLLSGEGTYPTSFGTLWCTLDADYGIPYTVIPLARLDSLDLSRHRVIILPEGRGYDEAIGKKGVARLEDWVRGGGTIVAIGQAGAWLRSKEVGISAAKTWAEKAREEKAPVEKRNREWQIPGAAFRTTMNEHSPLTFGITRPPAVLLEGSTTLMPVDTSSDNIVTIQDHDPVVAGFAWPESIDRASGSAYMIEEHLGRGNVITFVDEPYYRMFWKGTVPLLLNSVLYAPSVGR